MKPGNIKIGTWYKSGNILMFPYKENGEDMYGDRKILMITYQDISHWDPPEIEIRIHDWLCSEIEQHTRDKDSPTYIRNFLYADQAEWCIEEKGDKPEGDFRKATKKDFQDIVVALFNVGSEFVDEDYMGYET